MANLTNIEKRKLERAFGMSSGYVLDFQNRTFEEFFQDVAGIDIYDAKYAYASGSKANRMREFWKVESDEVVLRVLKALADDWDEYSEPDIDPKYLTDLNAIVDQLHTTITGQPPAGSSLVRVESIQFKAAMSFPGTKRSYVSKVVSLLRPTLPPHSIFFDEDYQSQLARPDLDLLLQQIYLRNSDLIVVFLCDDYESSDWCGLEWPAVRDIIKAKSSNQVMLVRFDDADISGLLSIDGYIDAAIYDAYHVAKFISERLTLSNS